MPGKSPLVSVIIPVYNAQKYISEAIESVIAQSYAHWELLVVDDGSTDDTLSLVKEFDDSRIIVKHQKNAGVSVARNVGLSLALGTYITFLDADDVLPKGSLEARVRYLEEHSDIDFVDGKILVKDINMSDTLRTYIPYYKGRLLPRLLALDSCVFFNVCYMFRKNILGSVRFQEGMTHAEDLLFYIELACRNNVMYDCIDKEIYCYRSGHDSTMTNLQGLENGYVTLLQRLKEFPHIPKKSYIIFKLKIMKIMFLSWWNRDKTRNAVASTHKILWI